MSIDWHVLNWIQDYLRCGFLDVLMPFISALGNGGAIWLVTAAVLLCFKKYRRHGVLLLIGLAAGVLIGNIGLKNIIARPRPCWLDTTVQLLIQNPGDYSFPSGHTLSSTIAAAILTSANRRFGYIAIPLAALIAFSRLYLFVHFPSDVLGAVCIGLLVVFVVLCFGGRIMDRACERHKAKMGGGQ